ncbi:hypothetical protein CVD25_06595 [Bacillus canaveralius]|uniref:Uncharacterized protein n=1 Tax=Bacillus canaveralius TaxID=1403243 RepID=A0A2N5GJ51_9BACI|nr:MULTISPECIES: hypothetical protein [Bacillus]PLR81082.1 hypothetical protein CU635_16360 [Bacillus canaveralius]PLR82725.1 hypothetical protein CVD23_16135 [Bacillus sp. V33-4]PLR98944.1 hypothetical protein CVD25_06595 [Bacillus canaveralius]RSK53770.1 hypothetical protein EJA13_07590 [Bacillus canaveralius]
MYRFTIDNEEWILRFSPAVAIEQEIKDIIVRSLALLGSKLPAFPHGDAFVIFNEKIGLIVFNVEKLPSFILTISSIVPREKWFEIKSRTLKKYMN